MSADADAAGLRIARGFLIAPLCGSSVFAGRYVPLMGPGWLVGLFGTVLFTATVAYSIALVVGVPTYLVLRRWFRPRFAYAVVSGGLVAASPFNLLGIVSVLGRPDSSLTCNDILEYIDFVGPILASGLVTGLVFWLVAVWRDPNPDRYLASHGAKGSRARISS